MTYLRIQWTLRRVAITVGILALATPAAAQVQQAAGSSTPIDQVLLLAQQAYDDLNYARADSVARSVLAVSIPITSRQRTQALMIIVASAFPEEVEMQKPTLARGTLRELVRNRIDLKFPSTLTWPGLDSLVEAVRRTTFGMQVSGDSIQALVGPDAHAVLRVRSTLPGRFQYSVVTGPNDSVIVFDSIAVTTNGQLRIPAMRGERPTMPAGVYTVVVSGTDSATADMVTFRYPVRVEAPQLEFIRIPASIDSSKLLPERAKRFGYKSLIPALLVGGGAYALSTMLQPQEGSIGNTISVDSKGMAVGGGMALVTIVAGLLDPGRRIPANIDANRAFGESFRVAADSARSENARRLTQYSMTMRFSLEPR
ncbi:MAG TPA: hypothetical protein VEB19_02310 [Gemmatimonadaceae bacterium]|nr:hypothetical protein [Gemmatimonadaceae bacterium]